MNCSSSLVTPTERLGRLLRPRTLAVIGGHAATEVVRQNMKIGFTGEIWPVHHGKAEICGWRTYSSIADLPGPPDAAFIGVNRRTSIELLRMLATGGAGGAVVYASGYAETGDAGTALQDELCDAGGDMPFLGPNCYGFINYFDRALTWPDQFGGKPVESGVAIITQSGNIGLNITMQRRALPIGYMITLGNQAVVNPAQAIEAVLDDPRVTVIGLHLESIDDPVDLASAVARARRQSVRVVALKTGRSHDGARIAQSHTAAMSSSDKVVDAYFRRIGIARVETIPALLETLKLLHYQGPLARGNIATLSCSGGEAALIADAAAAEGVRFVPLSSEARAGIAATLPELVSVTNPLDYHTFGWRDKIALTATFAAMMRAGAELNILILDFPREDTCETADWDIAADAMADAATMTGSRGAVLATLPEAMPEARAVVLATRGLVPMFGMVETLQAIVAAAVVADEPDLEIGARVRKVGSITSLSEHEAKRVLAGFGVAVPPGHLVKSLADATDAAVTLGFPVAAKVSAASLAHKTELGGVRLNLRDVAAVRTAATDLIPITGEILVERMIDGPAVELIVGVARDPVFGLYLVIGSGGMFAELVGDSATLLMPASETGIAAALDRLRVAQLLRGFRGAPPADTAAAIAAILAIQHFALAHRGDLVELDVNPLMVCAAGKGAYAADVFLRLTVEGADV